jgi:transposase
VPRLARLAASVGARRREILRAVSMGVSNALAESTNAKIKLAVAAGRGFRNFENLRALVMLRCSPVRPSLPGRA